MLWALSFYSLRDFWSESLSGKSRKKQGEKTVQSFVKDLQKGNYQDMTKNLNADSVKKAAIQQNQLLRSINQFLQGSMHQI